MNRIYAVTLLLMTGLVALMPPARANEQQEGIVAFSQPALLQKELDRFLEIQRNGGWPKIKATKKFYQKGDKAPAVALIKQRLRVTGEFSSEDTTSEFTAELTEAVKKIQRQFGYKQNGVVDASLIKDLNVSVDTRVDQLRVNIERARTQNFPTSGTVLIANIPEFKLHIYESGRHVYQMAIVVGKESNKTVVFNDEMTQIIFSPTWHVPESIVRNELLPAMSKSPGYLRRNGYVQTGEENGLPVIKQLPGSKNALGRVKFVFPNSHNIYFHDTPAKSLFEMRRRAFSHGCIRLSEPEALAQYLLRNNPEWTPQKIRNAMDSGRERAVPLKQKVAVSIIYQTVWVDQNGLNFREDIYGHDKAMAARIAMN